MTRSMQELRSQNESANAAQELCFAVVPRGGFKSNHATFPLYWLQAELPKFSSLSEFVADSEFGQALQEILIDPLLEELWAAKPAERQPWLDGWKRAGYEWFAERQFQPGVTDNLSRTVQEALELKGFKGNVASGTGFLFKGDAVPAKNAKGIEDASKYKHFHPLTDKFVVHQLGGHRREEFLLFPAVHLPEPQPPKVIPLDLDDAGLMALSQERLLALNLSEMKAIREHFKNEAVQQDRQMRGMPDWPTDVEVEIIAQTWSEHCKHKIFNATISHTEEGGEPTTIASLYKSYIKKPTFDLMQIRTDLLSVFEDN